MESHAPGRTWVHLGPAPSSLYLGPRAEPLTTSEWDTVVSKLNVPATSERPHEKDAFRNTRLQKSP